MEALQKENEELKAAIVGLEADIVGLEGPFAVVVSQNRTVKRMEVRVAEANISCNHFKQMVSGV